MDKIAVRVENLNKKFTISHDSPLTFQRAVYNFFTGKTNHGELPALKNLNFCINKSEAMGLIGPNSSGKSTLLRIIAGIYTPTTGSVCVSGKIAPCLELGWGFCMEFTGRENLYLYGSAFGLSRREIRQRIEDIRGFSGLNGFLDVPLKQYSLGMRMRLAFSLAVNMDSDILLIDEMLTVGDLSFKEKCLKKIDELKEKGKTFLLVSHQMDEIERLCERAILLDEGKIISLGPVKDVVKEYQMLLGNR